MKHVNIKQILLVAVLLLCGTVVANDNTSASVKALNVKPGLRNLTKNHFYIAKDSLHKNYEAEPGPFFAHIAMGIQTPISGQSDMGMRIEAGLGYWLNSVLAAQGSVILGSHDLNLEHSVHSLVDFAGCLDMMLNPFGRLANRYDRIFGFNFIGGLEVGQMSCRYKQEQHDMRHSNNYIAFSVGARLYSNDIYGCWSYYVEPRYTLYKAGAPYEGCLARNGGYYSMVCGMEFGSTEYAFRSSSNQPSEFRPTWSYALSGGCGFVFGAYAKIPAYDLIGGATLSGGLAEFFNTSYAEISAYELIGGIAAEYKYSPYSGVRLTADYSNYRSFGTVGYYKWDYIKMGYINFGVDYMFDIVTLLQGYTADRMLNATLAAGPIMGYRVATSGSQDAVGRFGVGAQVGFSFQVSFNKCENWSLFWEPRVRVFSPHAIGNSMTIYSLFGIKYTFSK